MAPPRRFPALCLAFLALLWTALAIAPRYRSTWLHENLVVFVAVPLVLRAHRRAPLANASWACLTTFLALHLYGAHHSYSEVPLGAAFREWFGLSRNHYDRLVHFAFGLLLYRPVQELFGRVASTRGAWAYYLPLDVLMALSMLYELMEWAFAAVVDPDAGMAFLGTQGDIWDAHKDMALATLGGILAALAIAAARLRARPRDAGPGGGAPGAGGP